MLIQFILATLFTQKCKMMDMLTCFPVVTILLSFGSHNIELQTSKLHSKNNIKKLSSSQTVKELIPLKYSGC